MEPVRLEYWIICNFVDLPSFSLAHPLFRSITDPPAWFEAQKCDHQHQTSGKPEETTGSDPGSRKMWYFNIKTTTSTTTLNFTHSPTHSNTHLHSTHIYMYMLAFHTYSYTCVLYAYYIASRSSHTQFTHSVIHSVGLNNNTMKLSQTKTHIK